MKVSIITVVWNAIDCIEQTLQSVKNQTYENIEFVVVDGKSTDGTLKVIETYRDTISTFISEEDEGLYFAMNKGKDLATGDFCIFVNAGDLFLSDTVIADMVKQIDSKEKIYYGNTVVFFDEKKKIAQGLHHQSIFYPRAFYSKESYNCKKYKVVAESDYTHRALQHFEKQHCDINMILSKLEGFRIHRYSKLKSTISIYKEVMSFMNTYKQPFYYKVGYTGHSILKFLAFKIGGLPLAANLVLARSKNYQENTNA